MLVFSRSGSLRSRPLHAHTLYLSGRSSDFVFHLRVLLAVLWGSHRRFVVSSSSAPLRLRQSRLLGCWRWRVVGDGCSCRTDIRRFRRRPLHHDLLLLLLITLAIRASRFLLLLDVSANDTEIPEHQIRDEHLLEKRSSGIGELDMAQSVNGSLHMNRVSGEV